jgi:MFS family permease
MISGAFFWGFFSDTLGRQKLLIAGYYLLAALVVASSFSQAFWILTVFKFLGGFAYVFYNSHNNQNLPKFSDTLRHCTKFSAC